MRHFSLLLCAALLAVPAQAFSAAPAKPLIGVSKIVAHPALDSIEKGLQDELKKLGVDAQFDFQNANGDPNNAAAIASKFKTAKVTVAVGIATPTSQALVNTLKDTPVVFSAVTDPVKAGLVASLAKGDKNVTGVSDMTPVKQQLQFFNRIKAIKKLGLITTSSEDNARVLADMAKAACKELGITAIEATVTTSAEVKQAAQSIVGRVDAFYITTDNTVVSALASVTDVASSKKVPVFSSDPSSAPGLDVLVAWGFDYYKMGQATARIVNEVIHGKSPAAIPVRLMTDVNDVELIINTDVAKKIGVTIPGDILKSANRIVANGKVTNR